MDAAVDAVVSELQKNSKPVKGEKEVEQVKPKFLSAYHNIDSRIIKLDCLQDAIYYLQEEYE